MTQIGQKDAILHWLHTPIGYYSYRPEYGNNINQTLFLGTSRVENVLDSIVDKIINDIGISEAERIYNLDYRWVEPDEYYLLIQLYDRTILTTQVV